MLTSDYNFDFSEKDIANCPERPRDYSKLMVIDRKSGDIKNNHYFDLDKLLDENSVLILNDTKVIPARIKWNNDRNEVFFLEKVGDLWKVMVRPGKKFRIGMEVVYEGLVIRVVAIDEDGFRMVKINLNDIELMQYLERYGQMPVPPYIEGRDYDDNEYNTVYSKKNGSVAAPTAGLHFTKQLLSRLSSKGVEVIYVTLNVGLGTFLPVKEKNVRFHKMHEESYEITYDVAKKLNAFRKEGRTFIAVGTTAIRVLEDNFGRFNKFESGIYKTKIFIKPGYSWLVCDGIITNFHLPMSTLIMLVSSFLGRKKTLNAYKVARFLKYKFYSFGDGMIII